MIKYYIFLQLLLLPQFIFAGEIKDMLISENIKEEISTKSRSLGSVSPPEYGITKIGFERTACLRSCPSYTVIINNDGRFKYVDKKNTNKKLKKGILKRSKLKLLQEFIINIQFFEMDTYYAVEATDLSESIIMVEKNSKKKYVLNYGNAAPVKLWALEELIDHLISTAEWETD